MNSTFSNQTQFEAIYKDHRELIIAIGRSFRLSQVDVDDLVQDVFIKIFKYINTLREPKAIRGWIKTTTRNLCLEKLKEPHSRQKHVALEFEVPVQALDQFEAYHIELATSLVRDLIDSFDHPLRQLIARKFYIEGQKVGNIAEELNLKQNTVLSHLRRFRLTIGTALVEQLEQKTITP